MPSGESPLVKSIELAEGTQGHLPRTPPSSPRWWKSVKTWRGWKPAMKWGSWKLAAKWGSWMATQAYRAVFFITFGSPIMYTSRLHKLETDATSAWQELLQFATQEGVTDGFKFIRNLEGYDINSIPEDLVAYRRFAKMWERLADKLSEEWKIMNVVSTLLVAGILTIFQIEGGVCTELKRGFAFAALIYNGGQTLDIAAGKMIQDASDGRRLPQSPPQTPSLPNVFEVERTVQEAPDEGHHVQPAPWTPSLPSIFEPEGQPLHVNGS
ncbi:hypothetical protein P691DRAFT_762838 [Macrolepiota fuliginosa MF-IS2]|uniref:Uncharacterized protein n=1 Tax=Macrolepiota fuliginosa MF-IS2 TaxID=1400762 RepID=A0A9P5X5V2_9AGAR|nr:hypothetical protein P691DRAFT_762838 [Macrolepiota fuliginosa MF-IS2]